VKLTPSVKLPEDTRLKETRLILTPQEHYHTQNLGTNTVRETSENYLGASTELPDHQSRTQ
jgi:hypothetical protein